MRKLSAGSTKAAMVERLIAAFFQTDLRHTFERR